MDHRFPGTEHGASPADVVEKRAQRDGIKRRDRNAAGLRCRRLLRHRLKTGKVLAGDFDAAKKSGLGRLGGRLESHAASANGRQDYGQQDGIKISHMLSK
jgi:hypothetical protein